MNQIHGFSISVYFMVLIDDLKFGYHTIHRHKNIQLKKKYRLSGYYWHFCKTTVPTSLQRHNTSWLVLKNTVADKHYKFLFKSLCETFEIQLSTCSRRHTIKFIAWQNLRNNSRNNYYILTSIKKRFYSIHLCMIVSLSSNIIILIFQNKGTLLDMLLLFTP